MTLGTAAIKSTMATSVERSRIGAYSVINSAVPRASGNATTIVMMATSIVPTIAAATPTTFRSGFQSWVVKNLNP